MKHISIIVLICMMVSVVAFGQKKSAKTDKLTGAKDKISYSVGASIGKNMKSQNLDVNIEKVIMGLRDAFTGGKLLMEDQEISDSMMSFQKAAMAKQMETAKIEGANNKKEGDAFLEANKKKDSVVALPSGLQYKILKDGSGKSPTLEDTVTVNYRGTLISGKEFDNSYKRGTPATFPLNHVIKGWTEGLQLMKPGSHWMLYIPPDLGYGERGMPQAGISPNAVLIFDVEMISFK